MTNAYPRGTREYVSATLTDTNGGDLTADTVELSIHRGTDYAWLPAEWVDGVVRTVDPVSFDQTAFPALGNYSVAVRLTDNPEIPIVLVGSLAIVS